jgi:thiamine-monophosphate kinase
VNERDFITSLKGFAHHPAARGLADDAAVLEVGGTCLVLTHDMIVEGIHFLPDDPPADVAWKLVAANLSDLAAKGAAPLGALLGYSLSDDEWDRDFAGGLGEALGAFGMALLGGDTVAMPNGAPRTFGLTAIGRASGPVPSRAGAKAGDHLWVTGTIGDAGAGLRSLLGEIEGAEGLVERYRNPRPRIEAGQLLAPLVTAMMDVSDGLLLDALRMAQASGLAVEIELGSIPLSEGHVISLGEDCAARLAAATAGDDYELLFAAPPGLATELLALGEQLGLPFSRIGSFDAGSAIRLVEDGKDMPLPDALGYEHIRAEGP